MFLALISSAHVVFIGSVVLALVVVVIAVRWIREINKMKKD
ncbi:MAG TPA: hypothetical protein VGM41_03995 [Chitinophagaceae bacterium]|jgi:hypothetical protein